MRLFLASSLDKTLDKLKEVAPDVGRKVLFVANAAEPWTGEDIFWVTNDRDAFVRLGFQVTDVDLHAVDAEMLATLLAESDILHICGGGVFYINELIKSKGFETVIRDAVKSGSVLYTGTSAGSIIASKVFSCFELEDEEVGKVKNPSDKVGLGLVDFIVVPHNNQQVSAEHHSSMIASMVNNPEALIFLRDNQAVWVDDQNLKILSV